MTATTDRRTSPAGHPVIVTHPATGRQSDPDPDHAGRWLGGAIGALTSLVAAFVANRLATDGSRSLTTDWVTIGLLGIPIGFALGRQLLPTARSGGWGTALMTGVGLGLIAPPLGALEILIGWGFISPDGLGGEPGLGTLILLPFAIPISYAAVVMTVPVGIAWAVAARLVSPALLKRVAAPDWLARLGARHAILVAIAVIVLAEVARVQAGGMIE